MDEYIKMCDCEEVQTTLKPYFHHKSFCPECYSDSARGTVIDDKYVVQCADCKATFPKSLFLPRLADLVEWLSDTTWDYASFLNMPAEMIIYAKGVPSFGETFTKEVFYGETIEQIFLKSYMWWQHDKVWTGTAWEPTDDK